MFFIFGVVIDIMIWEFFIFGIKWLWDVLMRLIFCLRLVFGRFFIDKLIQKWLTKWFWRHWVADIFRFGFLWIEIIRWRKVQLVLDFIMRAIHTLFIRQNFIYLYFLSTYLKLIDRHYQKINISLAFLF